ncbi:MULTISPECIES: glycosyltransferase family 39 protein [Arthrobacter]|uniref:Glycosyltransferase family 39 protein n=1 Tax=Arthrobacter terricola TaxID=2547396 RepID=A0A4V2ZUS2_9MICC|nr:MULTISPECIES: glycosyltransferase family 39 protein [Arthrobacter]MBT8158991.1 glycosyltransferase family 39 protein [Arthrobacter sp. GN70]TDG01659.1 glycosyltransferase family 39 protein [Arthrobacter terricola]
MSTQASGPAVAAAPSGFKDLPFSVLRWFRGTDSATPAWERPALVGLLALTSVLYLWGLDRNAWANSFYSAAVMSGADNWTAFFYGSSDPGNAISVDKPPMSLWIMSLSVRLFGLNSWSILVPQALMGVLSVYLLYRMVRKRTDAATGLVAGLFFAITPVATVMFRYNNPDALLTLLMIGAAYCALEAIDRNKLRWLIASGAMVGAGFLTKQLQVALILPAIALAYLFFSQQPIYRRFLHLTGGLLAAIVASGWWFVVAQTADPTKRPFVGGSRSNSFWELTLGYNGLDRLSGEDATHTMSATGEVLATKLDPGFTRFLQPQFSGQFGWFLPIAITGLGIAILFVIRRYGTTVQRTFLMLCAGWFVCSATVIAMMSGIVHSYYTIAVVPSLSCLAAFATTYLVRRMAKRRARLTAACTLAACLLLGYVSASRSASDFPWLPDVLLVVGALAIAITSIQAVTRQFRVAGILLVAVTVLLGPSIWSVNTVLSPHIGASVTAGPSILGIRMDHPDRNLLPPGTPATFTAVMLGDVQSPGVLDKIRSAPSSQRWAAAVVGSETAANYQLNGGRSVLAVGGFDGTDPFPTLEQFQSMVSKGEVGSFVIKDLPPFTAEGRGESARIVHWVESTFPSEIINGTSFFDLTK